MTRLLPRLVFCALVVFAVALFGTSQAALAQASAAGKWVGSLDVVHADGSVEPGGAYFSLLQNGEQLTGSAGESAAHQSPITDGKLAGDSVRFTVVVNPQLSVRFELLLQGDHLRGTATGLPGEAGSKIVIDAARADAAWHASTATVHVPDRLFETIAAMDKRLFDAYNDCDLNTLGALVTDDLEFYHDKTGLAVGRQVFIDSIRNNICGKVRRVLVPGSLEVYRLNQYGAVEIGVHRFQHPGHEEEGVGEAKFVTLWQFKGGEWKITRVISYDHGSMKK